MGRKRIRGKRDPFALNDSDRLFLFLSRMTELAAKRYYQTFQCSVTPTNIAIPVIDEELLVSFIATFRHFYLKESPTEIGHIHNILVHGGRLVGDSALVERTENIKRVFNKANYLGLDVFGENYRIVNHFTAEQIVELFLNSRYFHTDVRGFQFFFQLRQQDLEKARGSLQVSLSHYVIRLKEYIPIAVRVLASRVFPRGIFDAYGGMQLQQAVSDPNHRGVQIALPMDVLSQEDIEAINRQDAATDPRTPR